MLPGRHALGIGAKIRIEHGAGTGEFNAALQAGPGNEGRTQHKEQIRQEVPLGVLGSMWGTGLCVQSRILHGR